jgi:uncharacterized protein (TIGR02757 family)
MSPRISKDRLEALYRRLNRREFVHPDPLEFLYDYDDPGDREIVAFVASCLAYGRVVQILKSVSSVLERMIPSPFLFLQDASPRTIKQTFSDFRHRFTSGQDLSAMLFGLKQVLEHHGSLNACFLSGLSEGDDTILPAMLVFTRALAESAHDRLDHLVPSPERGSACKRLNLFLRWMVRQDAVDPGGWQNVPQSKLIVPVDTHMHRISLLLGFTARKQANLRTAMEITDGFRAMAQEDPVKYDFSLTRLGIRRDTDLEAFI